MYHTLSTEQIYIVIECVNDSSMSQDPKVNHVLDCLRSMDEPPYNKELYQNEFS